MPEQTPRQAANQGGGGGAGGVQRWAPAGAMMAVSRDDGGRLLPDDGECGARLRGQVYHRI